eukprot:246457-Amphidinium_carterae.1
MKIRSVEQTPRKKAMPAPDLKGKVWQVLCSVGESESQIEPHAAEKYGSSNETSNYSCGKEVKVQGVG